MQRREFILGAAGFASLSLTAIPDVWANDSIDTPRVLYVLLRGGMDGLTAVRPSVTQPTLRFGRRSVSGRRCASMQISVSIPPWRRCMVSGLRGNWPSCTAQALATPGVHISRVRM